MIEARGLTKRYGEVTAADGVTFSVAPGEVVGLLGPNGAGKTTVLRMLAGVLTPTAGEARIAGHGAEGEAFELKRSLGFLTGDTALYQRLTPREVLRYFGRLHEIPEGELDRRIEALVERFRLRDFADRPCGKLSAGQDIVPDGDLPGDQALPDPLVDSLVVPAEQDQGSLQRERVGGLLREKLPVRAEIDDVVVAPLVHE